MYEKTVLSNGIKILTEFDDHVRTVAVGIWVGVGSRDEAEKISGVSHFIEHLMFKGTETRNAKQIAEAFDDIGGQLNAYTTKEYTCYYAKIMDEHFDIATDILSDMLLHPKFASDDINKEKGVILEEINMSEDSYDELVFDVFTEALWQNHPLGRPILGTADSIEAMTPEDIINYYRQHYVAGNIVIAAVGNIKHQTVADRFEQLFADLPGGQYQKERTAPRASAVSTCKEKSSEQVNLCLGTVGLEFNNSELYTLQVISTVLGGGVSSRLFQDIREDRGLVYTIYSYASSYVDTGLFIIYAGLSSHNTEQVIKLVLQQLKEIVDNGITSEELERAKNQLKVGMLFSMESTNTRMSRLGKSEIYNREILDAEQIIELVDRVTLEDVQEQCARIFQPDKFTLAAVGPWKTDKSVKELSEQLFV